MFKQRIIAFIGLSFFSICFSYFTFAQTLGAVKDVSFILTSKTISAKKNDVIEVVLAMSNPTKQNITSFETWVSYDAKKLKGMSVEFGAQPDFDLNLIKSDPFVIAENVVKVSRVATSPTAGKGDMILATLKFQVLTDIASGEQLTFDFYKDVDGGYSKSSANVVIDDVVTSIIDESKLKSLVIPLSSSSSSSSNTNTNTNTNTNSSPVLLGKDNTNTNNKNSTLLPPTTTVGTVLSNNLQNQNSNISTHASAIGTGNSFAELSVQPIQENQNTNSLKRETIYTSPETNQKILKTKPIGVSFFGKNKSIDAAWQTNSNNKYTRIYYSKEKDNFIRYKDIKYPLEKYTFQNLQSMSTYYFVLVEVYEDGTEGEYSEEFEVTTTSQKLNSQTLKGSTTDSRVFSISPEARASLAKVPKNTTSGPEQNIFIFAIISILIGMLYTYKQKLL